MRPVIARPVYWIPFSRFANSASPLRFPNIENPAIKTSNPENPSAPLFDKTATSIEENPANISEEANVETPSAEEELIMKILKNEDPYEILGIGRDSNAEVARKAYYTLAMKFHPDTSIGIDHEQAAAVFQKVGESYRILTENPQLLDNNLADSQARSQVSRQRVDEVLMGERATRLAQSFSERFHEFFGENHDTLIYQHLKKRDLISAFEVFRVMKQDGIKVTKSTLTMLMRGCTMSMKKYEKFEQADHFSKHLWTTAMELFYSLPDYKLKPDIWAYNEAIRACSKVGNLRKALEIYDRMTKNPFTLPHNVISNNLIEACVNAKEYEKALMVAEEMGEIRTGVWWKGKFRADPVTFSLVLKAGVEGKLFEKIPKMLQIMSGDGLYVTKETAKKVLTKTVESQKIEEAKEILKILDSQRVMITDDVRQLVASSVSKQTLESK